MERKWRTVRSLDRSGDIDRRDIQRSVRSYHVVPKDGQWIVRKSGRTPERFSSKAEALDHARSVSRRAGRRNLFVHAADGTVRMEDVDSE